jgi:hypothetical protein
MNNDQRLESEIAKDGFAERTMAAMKTIPELGTAELAMPR